MKAWRLIALLTVHCADKMYCLPHTDCTYSSRGSLECKEADIPRGFDVQLIPLDVRLIEISCVHSFHVEYPVRAKYCNVLHDHCQPFPPRANLTAMGLYGFRAANTSRPPYGELLKNIRGKLTDLYIHHSQIGYLDADLLRGFSVLKLLSLRHNDISILSPDTFRYLIPPGVGGATQLRTLDFESNAMEHVDFSVFQPVSNSLAELSLMEQKPGIKSVNRSGPGFQLSLRRFRIDNNLLVILPREILETLAPADGESVRHRVFTFRRNNLCSKRNFQCCEMKEFLEWIWQMSNFKGMFHCGQMDFEYPSGSPLFNIERDWLSSCDNNATS